MFQVAVVEDDLTCAKQLQNFLCRYQDENGIELKVEHYERASSLLKHYKPCYDLILMDIEMPGLDGMSAAEEIRAQDENVQIIFITNIAKYAIHGYKVGALDYVLKPVNYYAFALKLRKAIRIQEERSNASILVNWNGNITRLRADSILYVEVSNHTLSFWTAEQSYPAVGTLRSVEETLPKGTFVRCNSCYLVNLKYVDALRQDTIVVAGKSLHISRLRKKEVIQKLTEYYKRGGQ